MAQAYLMTDSSPAQSQLRMATAGYSCLPQPLLRRCLPPCSAYPHGYIYLGQRQKCTYLFTEVWLPWDTHERSSIGASPNGAQPWGRENVGENKWRISSRLTPSVSGHITQLLDPSVLPRGAPWTIQFHSEGPEDPGAAHHWNPHRH